MSEITGALLWQFGWAYKTIKSLLSHYYITVEQYFYFNSQFQTKWKELNFESITKDLNIDNSNKFI